VRAAAEPEKKNIVTGRSVLPTFELNDEKLVEVFDVPLQPQPKAPPSILNKTKSRVPTPSS